MPQAAATLAADAARVVLRVLVLAGLLLAGLGSQARAQGQGNGNGSGSGGGGITPMAESNGITVTTKPTVLPAKLPNTGPFTQVFSVYNDKNYSIAVEYSCNDIGPVSCGDVFPGADQIAGHSSENVTVEYSTTSGTGQAEVELIATLDVGSPPSSKGAVEFGVYGPGKGVPIPVAQSREHLDRGACFTSGAGAAAGLSCGDLFVVEGMMPSFQTLGRDRSPTLYYNSATATGLTLVPVWYYEPATISMPGSARVVLAVGTAKDSVTFTPPASDCNYYQCADSFQVVVGRNLDWSSLPTGYHQATVTLRNLYSGAIHDSTVTIPLLVVNRSTSGFGKGWSLLGVEELVNDPADTLRKIWVAGDGSARVFRRGIGLTSGMLTSSGVTGFNATQAVNGSTTTAAWTSVGINSWIKVDLTTPRTITTLGLYTLSGTSTAVWNIQYSDNGTTWKTAFASFKPASSGWRRVVWGDVGAHRYWRLLRTGGSGPTISELSFGETNTWYGAPGAAPDSLVQFDSAGTWYRRDLKHGATVTFDGTGRHRATANRAGQRTRLVWTTVAGQVRLDSLVPPPAGTRGYKFHWNASTALLDDITDPTGRVLSTVMSGGKLVEVVAPGNLDNTRYAYDSRGVLVTRSVSRQHLSVKGDSAITRYTYANNGRVTKVEIQADSAQTQFETITLTPWDERGITAPVVVDTAGVPTRLDGPLTGTSDALDVLVDRFGAPRRMTHAGLGTVTRLWHDSTQTLPALVTKVELPHPTTVGAKGRIVTLSWNPRGNLVSQRDSSSHLGAIGLPTKAVSYAYTDAAHPDAVTNVADALSRDVDYTYDTLGLTATTTDARGHQTTFKHVASGSHKGLLWRVTEEDVLTWNQGAGYATPRDLHHSFIHDTLGNVRTDSLPHGVRTLYERDARGDVSAVWNYGGIKRSFVRDGLGRVLQDQQSTVKQTIPGGLNLLAGCDSGTSVCADSTWPVNSGIPATLTTTYVHSPSGITSVTDPRGVARSYRYGPRGEVRAETDDYGNSTVATTSTAGLLTSVLTRMNRTITYSYDVYGRRSGMSFPAVVYNPQQASGATIAYTRDLLGRITLATGDDGDVKQEFYADGSLKSTVTVGTVVYDSLSYTYDATGARTSLAVRTASTTPQDSTRYVYRADGDLDSVVVKWNDVATPRGFKFTWDKLGRRERVGYPLGSMSANFRYDALGKLRAMWVAGAPVPVGALPLLKVGDTVSVVAPSGRTLRERLRCGAAGQLGNTCGDDPWIDTESRYDRLGWLVRQDRGSLDTSSMQYDASGNMTRRQEGLAQPQYFYMDPGHNRLDSMTQAGNQRRDYLYDDDGSRAQDLIDQQAFAERSYYYDAAGRTSGLMIYHGFNEALQPQIFDDANGCKYDALGRQLKACAGTAPFVSLDGANLIRAEQWRIRHGPGLDDPLISRIPTGTSGARELYHVTDGAGRHYARAEASGSLHPDIPVASAYLGWEATGVTEEAHGYTADRLERPSAPGLSFFRNRVYDQATGRWTQEDPIGVAGGINLYQFNGNDPVTYRDPYGLCPEHMQDDPEECEKFNQRQVDAAIDLIRATRHPVVAPVYDGFRYRGANDDDMGQRFCNNVRGRDSKTGCTASGVMTLNADREVPNIAATIQHELDHYLDASEEFPESRMRSEGCAQRREIQAGRALGAIPDRYTPTTYNPMYECTLSP